MALSNWYVANVEIEEKWDKEILRDNYKVTKKNISRIELENGRYLEIYKNWIRIMKDDKLLVLVNHGKGEIGGLSYYIGSFNGNQIFYIIRKIGKSYEECSYVVGAAGYGYEDDIWVGVDPWIVAFNTWLHSDKTLDECIISHHFPSIDLSDECLSDLKIGLNLHHFGDRECHCNSCKGESD